MQIAVKNGVLYTPYPVGHNRLRVFVNSLLYWPGETGDYIEVDKYTVRLNTLCAEGDVIRFIIESVVILRKGLGLSPDQAVGLDRPELKPPEKKAAARILGSNPYICVSFLQ